MKSKPKKVRRSRRDEFAEINAGAVHAMREWAMNGLGFNCTFVDDDMKVIVGLAQRAVLAGLASDFSEDMQRRFHIAAEKHRADHESSLGFGLTHREVPDDEKTES